MTQKEMEIITQAVAQIHHQPPHEQNNVIVAQSPRRDNSPWNRPFRSWEAVAALVAFTGLIISFVVLPVFAMRDDVRDIKSNYVRAIDVVNKSDFSALQNNVSQQSNKLVQFDLFKEERGQRLDAVDKKISEHDQQISALQSQGARIESKIDSLTDAIRSR